ncbi:hypothetical protein A2866_00870 [Candidatus Roizmanbacteria bacterium RIFCSPHIGHO2_01_FULL_39_8]|uniref:(d)CMP kinase n=3 Tax=Candidatus Roizmaniibacteriota TaxID=1752723 RepID=A0A1F7GI37_9BACT|nr:MAG: hypothetical protein A2866_00870 [Candidatus Roizmanbacteria bacterium RIFCSPHIGHO2_01_FULL_39_8]OGK25739.1 MAG: hypothetical protein A3C28_00180 [Candidatus Roizmanbacteria bacterium RIFCSPHIGHO2_02_FULL_39_9]OGK35612.1 MAG: hypothetical protein A3F60_01460 [Candidatus Roizmanbacteria bacterium RIFCSPHIGHO2_12_FULL_39_8]
MHFKFDNIAISGGVAVGKSTLIRNLYHFLKPYGWKFKSIGEIHRQYLKDNIMPEASRVSDEFDRKIEETMIHIFETEKQWIIQSWLAGFNARNLKKTLRVLLTCKDRSLRIDRIVNRDKVTIGNAKKFLKQREQGNLAKYKRLYGNYNFWDPKYFHLVIDTYSSGPLETAGKVLDKLGYDHDKFISQIKL